MCAGMISGLITSRDFKLNIQVRFVLGMIAVNPLVRTQQELYMSSTSHKTSSQCRWSCSLLCDACKDTLAQCQSAILHRLGCCADHPWLVCCRQTVGILVPHHHCLLG